MADGPPRANHSTTKSETPETEKEVAILKEGTDFALA